MGMIINYGLGGFCADCDPSHEHPLNNIISVEEIEELVE
jgi:hypothetical protein